MADADIVDFNRLFSPWAAIVVVRVPRALTWDGLHLTSAGYHVWSAMMRPFLTDVIISFGLALAIVLLTLFGSFDSTFIYRGF